MVNLTNLSAAPKSPSIDNAQQRTEDAITTDAKQVARKWKPLVLALLIVALLLRIIAAVAVQKHVQAEGRQFLIEGDAAGYWELGRCIAAGDPYSLHTTTRVKNAWVSAVAGRKHAVLR